MKEYGGYLPFEMACRYKEIFDEYGEDNFVRLDCGRSAFWYALKMISPTKVYVPYLNCINSTDPLDELKIDYEYYMLEDDMTPKNINPMNNEAVIWINYYGNASKSQIEKVRNLCEGTSLIIDNCQAFFSEPIEEAYNCYSTRKFFGVCDGAYLVKKNLVKLNLDRSESADNIGFILKCIEKGTNACYKQNLENEGRLGKKAKFMSALTQKILKTIDYEAIQHKRKNNLIFLHNRLADINKFEVNIYSDTHMYYPLLLFNDEIRNRLIRKKIYTPTWWRHVPNYFTTETYEGILSKYMLMLPIDQRYNENDMNDIADIVIEEFRKCRK